MGDESASEQRGHMKQRVVYRVRDTVTGGWKIHNVFGDESSGPKDFASATEADEAARFLSRWRIVKVTIRSVPRHTVADE